MIKWQMSHTDQSSCVQRKDNAFLLELIMKVLSEDSLTGTKRLVQN